MTFCLAGNNIIWDTSPFTLIIGILMMSYANHQYSIVRLNCKLMSVFRLKSKTFLVKMPQPFVSSFQETCQNPPPLKGLNLEKQAKNCACP